MNDSWTLSESGNQEECTWLRDILPSSIPKVRIHTFSYSPSQSRIRENSNNAGVLDSDALTEVAEELLRDLTSTRKLDTPIAFLAHDIGGIIVKKVRTHSTILPQFII